MIKKYILCFIITIGLIFYLLYLIGQIKITADFSHLEPFKHSLPVYYNGFKLGHTTKVYPSPNFQSTRVDMKIRLKRLKLPANTSAMIKIKDKKEYIELEYPNAPYLAHLKHNTLIKGSKGINFENYLQEQAKNGGLDEIKDNINNTITSAGQTFDALTGMLQVLTDILNDVKPSLVESANNLNITTDNLAKSSSHINSSIQQGYIDNSLYNIQETTKNLISTTNNLTNFSNNLNKTSICLINNLIKNINTTISNVNQIIIGIGETLKKRFAGMRLLFGKID